MDLKFSDLSLAFQESAADMQAFAIRNGDFDVPDEVVLSLIVNFQFDRRLRKLSISAEKPTARGSG
jgi:hypothetical protein